MKPEDEKLLKEVEIYAKFMQERGGRGGGKNRK